MTFNISIAGITVEINNVYNDIYDLCRDYLTDKKADFSVTVSESDIEFERERSIAEFAHKGLTDCIFSDAYLETLAVYRKIAEQMLRYDAFLIHGSAIAVDGKVNLFIAPSGVGKTTHTRFWLQQYENAFIVNGDKPLIRFLNGTPFVCGTPWSGKEGFNRNVMLPLKAVCALFRGKENIINRVSFDNIFHLVIAQTYRPSDENDLKTTLQLIRKLGEQTRFYTLFCNLDPNAARVAKEGIDKDD